MTVLEAIKHLDKLACRAGSIVDDVEVVPLSVVKRTLQDVLETQND